MNYSGEMKVDRANVSKLVGVEANLNAILTIRNQHKLDGKVDQTTHYCIASPPLDSRAFLTE